MILLTIAAVIIAIVAALILVFGSIFLLPALDILIAVGVIVLIEKLIKLIFKKKGS